MITGIVFVLCRFAIDLFRFEINFAEREVAEMDRPLRAMFPLNAPVRESRLAQNRCSLSETEEATLAEQRRQPLLQGSA